MLYLKDVLAIRIDHRMLIVGQYVIDVPANRFRRLSNELQPTVRLPEVPSLLEPPA